jgi:hypothetical protein
MEKFLADWRPAPVSGLGDRACAAVNDRDFANRIAWSEAGDMARRILLFAVPLLAVSTLLAVAILSRGGRTEATRPERPFGPLRAAVFLGEELE